jgi:hypothetical protein
LRIYLQDHHAAAVAGVRRARQLAEAERASADGETLARIAADIDEDRRTLESILRTNHVAANPAKDALSVAAELAARLKPNGSVVQRSPLTTLIELEAMQMAARGKRCLWQALGAAGIDVGPAVDLDELVKRADDQLVALTDVHERRSRGAIGL